MKQLTKDGVRPARPFSHSPAVSVVIPAYKTADFISETLDSVFHQTFSNFEVIVVNDGSPDTEKLEYVLERFRPQIIYLKQENRGLPGARNTAIRRAQAEYLAFLDSDDCWFPKYLEKQVEFLEQRPELDVVYCDSQCFGDLRFAGQTFMQLCPSIGPVTLESLLTSRSHVCVSCAVARSKAVFDAGLFDEQLRSGAEDWDLWLRILHRGGTIAYHRAVLGRRRVHAGAMSAASVKMMSSGAQVLRKLNDTLDFTPAERTLVRKRLQLNEALFELEQAKSFLAHYRNGPAAESLRKANEFLHSTKLNFVLLGIRTVPKLTCLGTKVWFFALTTFAICRAVACFAKRIVLGTQNGDSTRADHRWASSD